MKLLVISHKETWADPTSPTGYSTIGGFPFQVSAISKLFNETTLLVLERASPLPPGAQHLTGQSLRVTTLPEPKGHGLERKLRLLPWLPRHLSVIWRSVRAADAVHALVPGDLGTIGILVVLVQKKRLFVRHCGTWGEPQSMMDRFLFWLLEKIAGGRNIVLATGSAEESPSSKNLNIKWIFSTSFTQHEFDALVIAQPWKNGALIKLITVARLSLGKNIITCIDALPTILKQGYDVHLLIVGDGIDRLRLENQTRLLNLDSKVRFLGNVNHNMVLETLPQSDIFVFPTQVKEGFPKALLEAMACGLPIIASPVSVIPHLVEQGCGLLLEDTSPKAVADAVIKMIADPIRMQAMGETARKVAAEYSLERWRDEIKVCLESAWGLPLQTGATESLLKNMANQSERVRSTNQNCS